MGKVSQVLEVSSHFFSSTFRNWVLNVERYLGLKKEEGDLCVASPFKKIFRIDFITRNFVDPFWPSHREAMRKNCNQ